MLAVIAIGQTNLPVASRIGSEFIRHHDTRHTTLFLKQLADRSSGGVVIPAALYEDVQYKTILIDGAPEPVFPAPDRNDSFIKVPLVAKAWRPSADLIGVAPPELFRPCADRLVCDDYALLGRQVFDQATTEREAKIQPHRLGDNFSWRTVTAIE